MNPTDDLLRRLARLENTINRMQAAGRGPVVSTANVSNPPTDAELDTAFGAASTLYDGFTGLVDDNAAGTTVWAVWVLNSQWWYEGLTAAI